MKDLVSPTGKEPQLAEVFTEGKGNAEWVAEEQSYKFKHQQIALQLVLLTSKSLTPSCPSADCSDCSE